MSLSLNGILIVSIRRLSSLASAVFATIYGGLEMRLLSSSKGAQWIKSSNRSSVKLELGFMLYIILNLKPLCGFEILSNSLYFVSFSWRFPLLSAHEE